jgi:hypothetical protein
MDAGGEWTLFIADLGPGDESLVVDWTRATHHRA